MPKWKFIWWPPCREICSLRLKYSSFRCEVASVPAIGISEVRVQKQEDMGGLHQVTTCGGFCPCSLRYIRGPCSPRLLWRRQDKDIPRQQSVDNGNICPGASNPIQQRPGVNVEWGKLSLYWTQGPMPQLKRVAVIQLLPIFPSWIVGPGVSDHPSFQENS